MSIVVDCCDHRYDLWISSIKIFQNLYFDYVLTWLTLKDTDLYTRQESYAISYASA